MIDESTLGQFASQSALVVAGIGADATLTLTAIMLAVATVLFLVVMAAVWVAWRRDRPGQAWWIWTGGVILPLAALSALVIGSTLTLAAIGRIDERAPVIEVTGHQYWWNVVYDPDGAALRDANEIFLPLDTPVTLRLRSQDVIHSYWVPSIGGKMDMIPGRINELTVTATRIGRFRGQCAEFCGLSHPLMAFEVVVVPPETFATFTAGLAESAPVVAGPQLARGRELYRAQGCPACHAIRGMAGGGILGPDLSRVGARESLGAGMWRMNLNNLVDWIADVQAMKPGAGMPSYDHLSGPDLRAVASYLASLT